MNKIPDPYLKDIIDSITRINGYLAEISQDKTLFFNDIEKQDAIVRRIEIIGEATKRLDDSFKTQYPQIPWKKMAGMRDVLIHDYDEVDLELVWEVVIHDLPNLLTALNQVLDSVSE